MTIQEKTSDLNLGFYRIDLNLEKITLDEKSASFFGFNQSKEIPISQFINLFDNQVTMPFLNSQDLEEMNQEMTALHLNFQSKKYLMTLSIDDSNKKQPFIHGFIHPQIETSSYKKDTLEETLIISNMTHEIRTPLNAIKGYAELLNETRLSEDQQSYVDHIQDTSKHLSKIVNDILDYSKLEAGKMRIEPKPFKLEKLLDDVYIMLKEQTKLKQLYLDVMNIDCPKTLIGDVYRIRQILINFVSNAAKFTEIGGISLTCKIDHSIDSHHVYVKFIVKDTGIGISAHELPSVFQAFDQANASTSRLYGGTGLGLHISLKIAKLMHGDIKLESTVNQGSTFTLFLPLAYEPLIDTENSVLNKKPMKGSRILLVDDNPLNQKLTERILSKLDMKVSIAKNGMEATNLAKSQSFNLIFMDIHMPIMDGYEATRIIRKHNQEVPIIAMSSDALYDDIETLSDLGMSDVIEKPVDPLSILNILAKWIPE
ncbi:MAG: response regulator [Acholeplasmataceae bacterium]|nr:response regulator [Acholeplasmataceae bacterium]